jgi:hypothetical protein
MTRIDVLLNILKRNYQIIMIVFVFLLILLGLVFGHAYSLRKRFPGFENYIVIAVNGKLYYSAEVSKTEAKRVAQMFYDVYFFNSKKEQVAFLGRRFNSLSLLVPQNDIAIMSDLEMLANYKQLEDYLNENSGFDTRIEIAFTDFQLRTYYELPEVDYLKIKAEKQALFKIHAVSIFHNILYNDEMPFDDVKILAKVMGNLKGYFPKNVRTDVLFLHNNNNYCVKLYLPKASWNDESILHTINEFANYLEYSGINKKVAVFVIDNNTNEESEILRVRD